MNPDFPTTDIQLVADQYGAVLEPHGFSVKPDTILSNSLEDTPAVPAVGHDGETIPGELGKYAFAITGFDENLVAGFILDRETGEPAPNATLLVQLAGVTY